MSKYTSKELTPMAGVLLVKKRCLDPRYLEFVMTMAFKTQSTIEYVESQIVKYANGDFSD